MITRVACIQTTATPDMAAGLDRIAGFVADAAGQGARLVMLPEMSAMLAPGPEQRAAALAEAEHPAVAAFARMAREAGIWLHCGSIAVGAPAAQPGTMPRAHGQEFWQRRPGTRQRHHAAAGNPVRNPPVVRADAWRTFLGAPRAKWRMRIYT